MNPHDMATELQKPIAQDLLASAIPARFAYTGLDGDPRVVPIGFIWTGVDLIVSTVPTSAKVKALRRDPRVAITIDTEGFPPRALLIRGSTSLELVDGVPDDYLASGRKGMTDEQYVEWERGVRHLYDNMVRITVTPDWVKLLDFETTIPKSVADLVAERGDPR